ncbi:hypothetical protein [Prevotella sp. 10(H)]|uniref:hypothetical protein n=1 Tax=Prevotella sp. 10(H) TaxID=1158294 RepID=UPI0004A73500|nr:hypothetical protein [Prevotella sp. 10(H)]
MNNKLRLFPHYFKYIGIALCFINPVSFFFLLNTVFKGVDIDLIKFFSFSLLTLGLSFIAFARERVEDEMMVSIRLQAIVFAFIFSVFYFSFMKPLMSFLLEGTISQVNSNGIISTMLVAYILIFYFLKWRLK